MRHAQTHVLEGMNPADLQALVEKHLPAEPRRLLSQISRAAEAHALPVYLVGGFVRDLLLGRPADARAASRWDFDFVVDGDAPALARALARELGGEVVVHTPFKTATWTAPSGAATDFATARMETYPLPGALPVVAPAPIADDLRRRDFTVNAMALRVDGRRFGELLDPHGGQADLAARVIRVLHPLSFQDDPTRMFRAARYEQRLDFNIARETLALIPGAWDSLAALTGDRMRHEFALIFRETKASAMLTRLGELDILRRVHPSLHWGDKELARAEAIAQLPVADWRVAPSPEPDAFYFALMLGESDAAQVESALARLNVNREVFQAVAEAVALRAGWARASEATAALDQSSELGVMAAYVLYDEARANLHDYLAHWRFVRAETTGDDLIALGLTPGPGFKKILWSLRAARLDGEVADASGERALLTRLLQSG